MSNSAKTCGELLKNMRELNNISRSQVADRVGVRSAYIHLLEKGAQRVPLHLIDKLVKSIGDYSLEPFVEMILNELLEKNNLKFKVELIK